MPRQQAMANSVRLRFVGDVIFGRYVDGGYRAIAAAGENPFSLVDDLLVGDVVVANLETPLVEALPRLSRQGYFFGADKTAALHLAGAGFTHVSLANNHSSDLGVDGLRETPRILDEHGIEALGAARSHKASLALDSFVVRGFRVGFLAVTARLNFELPGELQVPFVKTSELDDRLGPLLEDADGSHDLLVVLVHWGTEYSAHPDQQQRVVARRLRERGADLVIGHHPHVLQEIEVAEAGLVAYSLGNFLFENTSPDARLTGVLGVDVEGDGRCDVKVSFHPAVQRRAPFHPEPASDFVAEAARQRILPKSRDARQRWVREGQSLVTRFRRRGCPEG